jgi:hypothetical protein
METAEDPTFCPRYSTDSQSYREFDVKHGTELEQQWTAWFEAHNIPPAQVPFKGWVARDVARRTVSVLVYDWNVDDAPDGDCSIVYVDKDDDGNRLKEARRGVLTIQLESKPLPFP